MAFLKIQVLRAGTFAAVAVAAITISAVSQEKKIKRSDLPAPVQAAVAAQGQGATVKSFSKEKEKGQTYYEAELEVDGHTKDVLMDPQGNVVEVEEEVALDTLPAAVREGLQKKAGGGKLVKVESLTKHDRLVAYEAQVITKGKKSEVQVGPNGQTLNHQE
jgi:hypothetical protein